MVDGVLDERGTPVAAIHGTGAIVARATTFTHATTFARPTTFAHATTFARATPFARSATFTLPVCVSGFELVRRGPFLSEEGTPQKVSRTLA